MKICAAGHGHGKYINLSGLLNSVGSHQQRSKSDQLGHFLPKAYADFADNEDFIRSTWTFLPNASADFADNEDFRSENEESGSCSQDGTI